MEGEGKEGLGEIATVHEETAGVMAMFTVLTVVMVLWKHTSEKTVRFEDVQYFASQLHCNKAASRK